MLIVDDAQGGATVFVTEPDDSDPSGGVRFLTNKYLFVPILNKLMRHVALELVSRRNTALTWLLKWHDFKCRRPLKTCTAQRSCHLDTTSVAMMAAVL
jgi:hypothetical protein